jgi:linolenate 9R-lipoxygenase
MVSASNLLNALVGDPRTTHVEPRFQKVISGIAQAFGDIAQTKGKRVTHSFGTVAYGTFEVCAALTIPPHRLFTPGQKFPVLLRHGNIKGFPDDAILDGRGAAIRVLQGSPEDSLASQNVHQPVVDILLNTGRTFFVKNAALFSRWLSGSVEEKKQLIQEFPVIQSSFSETIRNPASYTKLHYYSQTTYRFISAEDPSRQYFLRYRLINVDRSEDTGFIPAAEVRLPLDYLPRLTNDFRPTNYLQQDFRQRVLSGGVQYILQLQLQEVCHPEVDQNAELNNELAKDCTLAWDESLSPFQDVGILTLKEIVPDELAEQLEFNPYHAPADLALILAHTIHETASINHLRSIVYQISANMRKYQTPSAKLVDWGADQSPSLKEVFRYVAPTGADPNPIPRFDPTLKLPPRVAPKPRLVANLGLTTIPAKPVPEPLKLLGISGVFEILQQAQMPQVMPANLTRCRPDKFSDAFFVERRLNGFNPGRLRRVQGHPWHYIIRYDSRTLVAEPSGIFPSVIEARFTLQEHQLRVHSIQYQLSQQQTTVNSPQDTNWEWAKRLFRCAEFVFQEAQSHLARTHLNLEQYAMAYYRNIRNNPIKLLIEPHFEGLLNVNRLGATIIFGDTGVIPEASSLNPAQVEQLIKEEISRLNYKSWTPHSQILPDLVTNNYYDRAALAVWNIITQYVSHFFTEHAVDISKFWPEIQEMSLDLVTHSILKPEFGSLVIDDPQTLEKLCIYVIYHATFVHSWVNYKQYEDGGDIDYATLGLWDSRHPSYDPVAVTQRNIKQVVTAWTLSHVRYNPIMESGPSALKNLLWEHRFEIEPGLPLELLMMSIHI